MMKKVVLVILFACFVFVSGCSDPQPLPDEKITNVVRIFMHDPDSYSFMVQESGSTKIGIVSRRNYPYTAPVSFFADVPQGEKMWVIVHHVRLVGNDIRTVLEIHIHSPKDVEGAGWDHGKQGRGQTIVVE